jgi:DNA-binding SARP family transcriptional activator/WD40 repeat protein
VRFLVLGPLEVVADGGDSVPIAGSKERTVLAFLLSRGGRVVSVDDLIEELWGEHPPRTAEKTVGSYVSRLRRILRPGQSPGFNHDVIVSRGAGYALEPDGHLIDALRFEQLASDAHRLLVAGQLREANRLLEEALDLWRGAAYQGYRYTNFGASEGERLEELRRTASEDLIDSRLAAGDASQLVAELQAMVREEPLRERRSGQLMVALYRAGRQAEALQVFMRAREVLVGELGIEPGPELQRLHAAILAQDPELERGWPVPERGWPVPPEPGRATDVCPYKGLARFETADADFFFGREQVVAEAVGHLVGRRFLAIVGPSGSGKSSLLRAGLLHALGSGALPGSDRWAYSVIRPSNHPLDTLAHTMDGQRTVERRLLAIDQFEELFSACSDEAERAGFLDAITEAASVPDGTTTIVIAMRADFYGRCAEHRAFASLLASDQILVGPMDREELRRAIELPAQQSGLKVEGKLVDSLVSDTVGQPGGLPLLSTALLELWTRRRDRTLRLEDYMHAGGVKGAVARLAEEAFGRLDSDGQAAAKRILLRLAAPGETSEVIRRRAPLSEFDLDRDADASRALKVLTDARLVTVSEGTTEVAHEALLHEWPRLRTWLEDDAEGRKLHRRITESSRTWDEGGRDPADLYRGARLTAAWEWAEPHRADLNDLERAFLRASRTASEGEAIRARRTNRRLRGLLAGVGVLLAVSLVIGKLALDQRNRATAALTLADAGRLASRSRLEPDPQLALLMAREAVHIDDSPETQSALFAALERTPAITDRIYAPGGASPAGDETQWIEIAPDGRTLAIGDAGRTVEFFDVVRRQPIAAVDVGSGTERAAFSPDGKTLAVVTSTGGLVAIDVATRAVRDRVRAEAPVDAIAFDPRGGELVTAEHGTDLREFLVSRDPVTLEPTGRRVLTPGRDGAEFPQISRPLSMFAMAFAADGSGLVTTRDNGPTMLWGPGLTPIRRYTIGGQGVAVSPNGRVAALIENSDADNRGTISFLNLRSGDVRTGSGGHHGPYKTVYEAAGAAFTPDGRSVVTVGNDSRLLIWDVATASTRTALAETGDLPLRGPALSLQGTTAYTTDRNRDVVVWDLSGRHRFDRPFTAGTGFPQWPWFALSPDGRMLAVPSSPPTGVGDGIWLIDTPDLRVVRRIPFKLNGSSTPLAFSPDSRTLAVGTWNGERTEVRLWDVASGRMTAILHPIPDQQRLVTLAFSPDGSLLVGGGGPVHRGLVYVWRPKTPDQPPGRLSVPGTVEELDFTPDGARLVVSTGWGDGGYFVLWDRAAQRIVKTVRADDAGVLTANVSTDGRTLMTGGQTGAVRLWDLATGTPRGAPLTGLGRFPDTVDLAPDGRTAVGADAAGNVLLWDVPTRSTIGDPFPGPVAGRSAAASFTPDGHSVVVVSDTGQGWVWDVKRSDWLARACQVAGRSFTQQEWRELLPDRPYHATCGS